MESVHELDPAMDILDKVDLLLVKSLPLDHPEDLIARDCEISIKEFSLDCCGIVG